MRHRVVVHPDHPTGLPDSLPSVESIDLRIAANADEVHQQLADGAQILVTFRWEDRFLQPALRWVAGLGAGAEQYPVAALERAGVVLTSARGVHTSPVRDHAFALLLALVRSVPQAVRHAERGVWQPTDAEDLEDMTLAVLGLGAIGEAVAQLAQAAGMRVTGVTRSPERYGGCVETVFRPDALLEACRQADALVVTVPGGDSTRHLVGDAELEALGAGWLVNVGRGTVVDESALVRALTRGRLRGAGLDVFEAEPLPSSSPLWRLPNVIVTPHVAAASSKTGQRWARLFCTNLAAFEGRSSWRNRVTRQ